VSHPAFSHVTERYKELVYDIPKHEDMLPDIISGSFRKKVVDEGILLDFECLPSISDILHPNDKDKILQILTGKDLDKIFLKELIDGPIDADNLDYLRRDAYHIGLPRAFYDDRIFSSFVIGDIDGDERILFRDSPDTVSAILSVLEARYWLTKIVYRHHATLIAERMFLEALNVGFDAKDGLRLFAYGDEEFISYFKNKMREDNDTKTLEILADITNRNLFKRAFVTNRRFNESTITSVLEQKEPGIKNIRDEIENDIGLNNSEILIDSPKKSKWKETFDVYLNSYPKKKVLSDYARIELDTLKEQYKSTEIFAIYLKSKPETSKDYAGFIIDYCKERNWVGYYVPKDPLEIVANEQYKIDLIINRMRNEKKASLEIIKNFIETDKYLSREQLSVKNNIKPTTVSQYLGYITETFSESGLKIFDVKREGGVKEWQIKKKIKEHLKIVVQV
jgi:HD superfamily phosphohydrolase